MNHLIRKVKLNYLGFMHYKALAKRTLSSWQVDIISELTSGSGVILTYFTRAFGDDFTEAMRTGWTNFMTLFVSIVVHSAEGDYMVLLILAVT